MATQEQGLAGFGGGIHHGAFARRKQLGEVFTQFFAQFVIQIDQRLVQKHERGTLGQSTG